MSVRSQTKQPSPTCCSDGIANTSSIHPSSAQLQRLQQHPWLTCIGTGFVARGVNNSTGGTWYKYKPSLSRTVLRGVSLGSDESNSKCCDTFAATRSAACTWIVAVSGVAKNEPGRLRSTAAFTSASVPVFCTFTDSTRGRLTPPRNTTAGGFQRRAHKHVKRTQQFKGRAHTPVTRTNRCKGSGSGSCSNENGSNEHDSLPQFKQRIADLYWPCGGGTHPQPCDDTKYNHVPKHPQAGHLEQCNNRAFTGKM
jgi:hypothetical protein